MIKPHWLDRVFTPVMGAAPFTSNEIVATMIATNNFKDAIVKAQVAFDEAQQNRLQHPNLSGASPAQQARVAFLKALNAD